MTLTIVIIPPDKHTCRRGPLHCVTEAGCCYLWTRRFSEPTRTTDQQKTHREAKLLGCYAMLRKKRNITNTNLRNVLFPSTY